MALQTSGQITLNDIHVEAGGSSGTSATINDSDIRALISKSSGAQMSFNEWYGASNSYTLTSGGTVNGQAQRQEITVSSFISAGTTLIIPSNIWIWSNNISTAALIVDVSCTIENYGKIIGKGGNGRGQNQAVQSGGPAIHVTASGVTIQNKSGAYIAGGGGGGAGSGYGPGGGAAGGGQGGDRRNAASGGAGGALNAVGGNGTGWSIAYGGGSGGGGGYSDESSSGNQYGYSAGGGGRILPGVGGEHVGGRSGLAPPVGVGGSGGNAGNNGASQGNGIRGAGGGGWGASGGTFFSVTPGSGGAAISKTTSYSLTNSGTIYGST